MKKRIMTVCLLISMIFVTGCGKEGDVQDVGESVSSTETIEITEEQITGEEPDEIEVLDQMAGSSILGRITYVGESYAWEEVSITIPQAWAGKYIVKENADGVSIIIRHQMKKMVIQDLFAEYIGVMSI